MVREGGPSTPFYKPAGRRVILFPGWYKKKAVAFLKKAPQKTFVRFSSRNRGLRPIHPVMPGFAAMTIK